MTKNNKNQTALEILEDLAKSSNNTDSIEGNIRKLMKDEEDIKKLIYYLNKCDPIVLLRIKSNLENYNEITNLKRTSLFSYVALCSSVIFSMYSIISIFIGNSNIYFLFYLGVLFLGFLFILIVIPRFIYRDKILKIEQNIKIILYLVDFMLKNKKDNLNEYSENLYTKNKKAPVNNTSAEK